MRYISRSLEFSLIYSIILINKEKSELKMSILEFISSLINSLAWPISIIIILIFFRKYIIKIIPSIEKFKYKDFEVEFAKTIKELMDNSKADIESIPQKDNEKLITREDKLFGLLEISPRSAIIESWLLVETAASNALQKKDPEMVKKTYMVAPLRLGQYLNRFQIINGNQLNTYNKLREIRNKAVHIGDAQFNLSEVSEYIKLSVMLANQIENGEYES